MWNIFVPGTKADLNLIANRSGFNACYKIDCGGDLYGIFSMVHTNSLHAIEVGLVEYMLEILFDKHFFSCAKNCFLLSSSSLYE
jgi:hypothetical protein